MGAKLVKPDPPADNKATDVAKIALDGFNTEADHFFQSMRLGDASNYSLGYKICDGKLTDQEFHIHVQDVFGQKSDDIKKAVKAIFSGDWEAVTNAAIDEIIPFLGDTPTTTDLALNETWGKSYLLWENESLTNTSIFIRKTNCKSIGTAKEDVQHTLLACVCRGVVDYADVDPQVLLYEVNKTLKAGGASTGAIAEVFKSVQDQMKFAAQMAQTKRMLESGVKF